MRRILIALSLSVVLAVVMHVLPHHWFDEFIYIEVDGKLDKVFPRGWPLTYLVEVEFHDNLWVIGLKIVANIVIGFLLIWSILFLWNLVTKRGKARAD